MYAIECRRCGSLYVRETGRKLSERFREHRRNVLNDKSDNEVAYHFSSNGQSVQDMMVCGLVFCSETLRRKLIEQNINCKIGLRSRKQNECGFRFSAASLK